MVVLVGKEEEEEEEEKEEGEGDHITNIHGHHQRRSLCWATHTRR